GTASREARSPKLTGTAVPSSAPVTARSAISPAPQASAARASQRIGERNCGTWRDPRHRTAAVASEATAATATSTATTVVIGHRQANPSAPGLLSMLRLPFFLMLCLVAAGHQVVAPARPQHGA